MQNVERVSRDLLETTEDDEALPATAWNSRNLAEIWIWIRYCAISREKAWTFHSDALRDMRGLADSLSKVSKFVGAPSSYEDSTKAKIAEVAKTQLGVETLDGDYERVSVAAKAVALDGWYGPVYKFLSKFAHPTAGLMIGTMHQAENLRELQSACLIHGTFAARQCLFDLEKIIPSGGPT